MSDDIPQPRRVRGTDLTALPPSPTFHYLLGYITHPLKRDRWEYKGSIIMKGCLNHRRLQTQLKCSMDPSRHQGETLAWEKIGNKVQIPDLELHQWASQFCRDCGQLTSGQLLAGMARVCWGGSHISEPEWHTWLSSGLSFMTLAPRALAHSFAPHTFAHRLCAWDCAGPEQVAEGGGQRCPRKVDSLAWTRDQCSPTCRTVDLWGALVLMQKVQPGKRTSIPDWIHHTGAPYRYYSRWPRAGLGAGPLGSTSVLIFWQVPHFAMPVSSSM